MYFVSDLALSLLFPTNADSRYQTASFAPFSPSFHGLSASASVIIYNCELRVRLALIISHDYGLYIRTLITNYLTWRAPRCRRGGVIESPAKSSTHTRMEFAYANVSRRAWRKDRNYEHVIST